MKMHFLGDRRDKSSVLALQSQSVCDRTYTHTHTHTHTHTFTVIKSSNSHAEQRFIRMHQHINMHLLSVTQLIHTNSKFRR